MHRDFEWLTASCFCPKMKWVALLPAIREFVSGIDRQKYRFYQIHFNDALGENIRISVLCVSDDVDRLGREMEQYFGNLFLEIAAGIELPAITSIFLPFPTNRIEFGLYSMPFAQEMFLVYEDRQEISRLIMDALSGEEITEDTLISFSLYLQIALIKACLPFLAGDIDTLLLTFAETKENTPAAAREAIAKNLDILRQIAEDVMDNEHSGQEMKWLSGWIDTCMKDLSKRVAEGRNANENIDRMMRDQYRTRVARMQEHMGLSNSLKETLRHLTIKALQSFYK
jgi:hypothetical protein